MNFLKLHIKVFLFVFGLVLIDIALLHAQNQNWIHIMNGDIVTGILEKENEILGTTASGGIVSIDKNTLKTSYTNRFNSAFRTEYFSCAAKYTEEIQWFGSVQYLVRKQGDDVEYFNPQDFGLPIYSFHVLAGDDKGNAWVGTSKGLLKFDGNNWQTFTTANSGLNKNNITAIFCQKDTVWVGMESGGLVRYDSGKWTNLSNMDSGFSGMSVTAITKDKKNQLWIGTEQIGPLHFNGQKWVKHLGSPGISQKAWVRDIAIGKDGEVFVGYFHREISKFNGSFWENVKVPENFANVNKLLVDTRNRLWVAMYAAGTDVASALFVLDGQKWTAIQTTQYLPNMSGNVWALENSCDGNIWVSAPNKIALGNVRGIDQIDWQVLLKDKLNGDFYLGLYIDGKENYWVASLNGGLYKFDGDSLHQFNTITSAIPTNNLHGLTGDRNGKIYIKTHIGLISFDGKNWQLFTKENSMLPSNIILDILVDKDNSVWIATNAGLAHIKNNQWKVYNGDNSGLPSNYVETIAQDRKGNIWVGTYKGLAFLKNNQWQVFNTDNSDIPSNYVNDIEFDILGHCWLATDYGISTFDGTTWRNFNPGNSKLPGTIVNILKFDGKGNLWMGIPNKGLTIFNESKIETKELPPDTLILFPNPTQDFLNFRLDEKYCGLNYMVVNNIGQILHSEAIKSTTQSLNVEQYSSGVYYIVIPGSKNALTGKFVKW